MTEEPQQLPAQAWVMAWAFLVGQLMTLAEQGRGTNSLLPSMLLGAVIIGWIAHGVLRARTVRVVLVWIVLFLAGLAYIVGVFDDPSGWGVAQLAITAVQFVYFVRFTKTPYYAWQRSRPHARRPSLAGLVAIAIAVGALGGVVGANDNGFHADLQF